MENSAVQLDTLSIEIHRDVITGQAQGPLAIIALVVIVLAFAALVGIHICIKALAADRRSTPPEPSIEGQYPLAPLDRSDHGDNHGNVDTRALPRQAAR